MLHGQRLVFDGIAKAVVEVIMDQRTLGGVDSPLDGVKLLNDLGARPMLFDQTDHVFQVTTRPLEAIDDLRVTGVNVIVLHGAHPTRGIRIEHEFKVGLLNTGGGHAFYGTGRVARGDSLATPPRGAPFNPLSNSVKDLRQELSRPLVTGGVEEG